MKLYCLNECVKSCGWIIFKISTLSQLSCVGKTARKRFSHILSWTDLPGMFILIKSRQISLIKMYPFQSVHLFLMLLLLIRENSRLLFLICIHKRSFEWFVCHEDNISKDGHGILTWNAQYYSPLKFV